MNETMMQGGGHAGVKRGVLLVLILLALFLLAKTVSEVMGFRLIGAGMLAMNTITVEGDGEAVAIPDIGEFSFSVVEKASTVAVAQDSAAKKMNAILEYLKGQGVADTDVKTVNYNVGPQYEWQQGPCAIGMQCSGKSVLTGYEVSQTISVKVRDTKKAGDLLSGIGSTGATELSGLTFSVDDKDKVQDEARTEAITKAKAKADKLASELGVRLVRIVSFDEQGSPTPGPVYYGMGAAMETKQAVAPSIPTGENKTTSHVTITYEIR